MRSQHIWRSTSGGDRVEFQLGGAQSDTLVMETLDSLWSKQSKRSSEAIVVDNSQETVSSKDGCGSPDQKRSRPLERAVRSKERQVLTTQVFDVLARLRGPEGEALPKQRQSTLVELLDAAVLDVLDEQLSKEGLATIQTLVTDAFAALAVPH